MSVSVHACTGDAMQHRYSRGVCSHCPWPTTTASHTDCESKPSATLDPKVEEVVTVRKLHHAGDRESRCHLP